MKKRASQKPSHLILQIQLPIITISLITLLISYLIDRRADPLLANRYYTGMLEYIIAGIAIAIGGALLARALECEREESEKE